MYDRVMQSHDPRSISMLMLLFRAMCCLALTLSLLYNIFVPLRFFEVQIMTSFQ
jgi:hypothetical protein